MENNFSQNLKEARQLSKRIPAVRKHIKDQFRTISLMVHMHVMDMPFVGIALTVALLKDILDFVGIGSLPAIGTAITIVASIVIAAAMFIPAMDSGVKAGPRAQKQLKNNLYELRRIAALLGGTGVEMIFGIDFLPVETLMVIYLYHSILQERKKRADEAREAAQENHATA